MWYFKGRRRRYDSPYTGKEVDAAVAKGGALPDLTVAEAGKFLRVNNDGKIDAVEYPIETQVNVVYSGDVTTTASPETVSVVEFSGTTEDFSQLNVVVNNETLVYNSSYNSFDDANETVSILLADGYIKLFAYNANTFAVEIKQINEVIDEDFKEGVEKIIKAIDEYIYIQLTVTSAEFLQLSTGNTVSKTLTNEIREIVDSGDYKKINFIISAEIPNNPQILIRSVASSDVDRQWGSFLQFVLQGETASGFVAIKRTISNSNNTVNLSLTQFN